MDGRSYDREIEDLERGAASLERQLDRTEAEVARQQQMVREYSIESTHLRARLEAMNADNADLREQITELKAQLAGTDWQEPSEDPEIMGFVDIDTPRRPKKATAFVITCPECGEVGRIPFVEWNAGMEGGSTSTEELWDQHVAQAHTKDA